MKLTTNKKQLERTLNAVNGVKPESLILEVKDKQFRSFGITETGVFKHDIVKVKNDETLKVSIRATLFCEIVRKLGDRDFVLEMSEKALKIGCGNSNFNLNFEKTDTPTDFWPSKCDLLARFCASVLTDMVKKVAFACAEKENRPILTGINLHLDGKNFTLTGLDGARLSSASATYSNKKTNDFNITVAAKDLLKVLGTIPPDDVIDIYSDGKKLFLSGNGIAYSLTIYNSEYPDTEKIKPKSHEGVLTLDRQELIDALELVSIVSNEKTTVKFNIDDKNCSISANTNELGCATRKIKDFTYDGKPLEIIFSSAYLLDAAKAITTDKISINFNGKLKPFFMLQKEKDNSTYELMTPMRE